MVGSDRRVRHEVGQWFFVRKGRAFSQSAVAYYREAGITGGLVIWSTYRQKPLARQKILRASNMTTKFSPKSPPPTSPKIPPVPPTKSSTAICAHLTNTG